MGKYCIFVLVTALLLCTTACDSRQSTDSEDFTQVVIKSSVISKKTSSQTQQSSRDSTTTKASSTGSTTSTTTSTTTSKEATTTTTATFTTTRPTASPIKETEVKAVNPTHGAWIVLANPTVYDWWKNYHSATTNSEPYVRHADIYYPNNVTLRWDNPEAATEYRVTLSTNADLRNAKTYTVRGKSLTMSELFVSTTYYWQIEAIYPNETKKSAIYCFFTADSPRWIKIDGVSNTRDIGGYDVGNGYRIKQGMIYRGATLDNVTAAGKDYMLKTLGIKTDLDLRTPGKEGTGVSSPLGSNVKYINIDGRRYYKDAKSIATDEGKKIIAQEIRPFADPNNYPIFMHCSAGRDRTGCLALIIEGLLGMSKEDLLMEYELFVFSERGTTGDSTVARLTGLIESVYDYLDRDFQGDTFAEKVEKYLLSCGVSAKEIQAIRAQMLENAG